MFPSERLQVIFCVFEQLCISCPPAVEPPISKSPSTISYICTSNILCKSYPVQYHVQYSVEYPVQLIFYVSIKVGTKSQVSPKIPFEGSFNILCK